MFDDAGCAGSASPRHSPKGTMLRICGVVARTVAVVLQHGRYTHIVHIEYQNDVSTVLKFVDGK